MKSPREEPFNTFEASRLITRLDQLPRRPLPELCEELRCDFLHRCRLGEHADIIACYNLGSLYQFQAGELSRAERLCHHAIAICRQKAAGDRKDLWMLRMLQPYLNVARLAALRGETAKAVRVFRQVFSFISGQTDFYVNDYRIPVASLSGLEKEEPGLKAFVSNVFLFDSIKAFLVQSEFRPLLDFIDEISGFPVFQKHLGYQYVLMETRARALLGMGESGRALEVLSQFVRRMNSDKIEYLAVFALIAAAYRQQESSQQIVELLQAVQKRARNYAQGKSLLRAAQTLHLLAVQQFLLFDYENARQNADQSIQSAESAGDEITVLKSLVLLTRIEEETRDFAHSRRQQLTSLATSTFYRFEKALAYLVLAQPSGNPLVDGRDFVAEAMHLLATLGQACQPKHSTWIPAPDHSRLVCHGSELRHGLMDKQYETLMRYSPSLPFRHDRDTVATTVQVS
ncbi:MAG TPA: hypothetical protein VFN23_00490 [Ktedonobacteraceae bacterium]|nr:hypothetical protein [Ktedonobacteraceae bacterium]